MRKRSSLLAFSLILIYPFLLYAQQPAEKPLAIERLSPALSPEAASLAAPPALLARAFLEKRDQDSARDSSLAPEPPPDYAGMKEPFGKLCGENRRILEQLKSGVPASELAFGLREMIDLRCQQVLETSQQPLTQENLSDAMDRVASPDVASTARAAAAEAPSLPQGAALTLEQRILTGVTDFLVARAQQELVNYVVNDFSKKLCDSKASLKRTVDGKQAQIAAVDMTTMFPRACEVLGFEPDTSPEFLDLRQIGSAFEQALKRDLQDLPETFLRKIIAEPFCKTTPCEDRFKLRVAIGVYMALEAAGRGESPILSVATAVKNAVPASGCPQEGGGSRCALRFFGIVLEAFGAQYRTIQGLDLQDAEAVTAFVDLLSTNVSIQVDTEAGLQGYVQNLETLRQSLRTMVAPVRRIVSNVKELQGGGLSRDDKVAISHEILDDLGSLWSGGLPDFGEEHPKFLKVIQEMHEAWVTAEDGAYDRLVASLFSLAKDLDVHFPLPQSVQQYLPLITALATAETPEQVAAAFEKYAAPLGSWREKQTGARSLTLTGFAGGTLGGLETTGDKTGNASRFALFLPVGLDWTLNRSLGLFFSLIDLGNLAEIRLDGEDIGADQAKLEEVVSPGAWLRYSVRNTPLALGIGGARRRLIGGSGAQKIDEAVWQFGGFIAVDVTILPLFRSAEKD